MGLTWISAKSTWKVEENDPLVDCILQDILDKGNILDKAVEYIVDNKYVLKRHVKRIIAVDHFAGDDTKGDGGFFVSNNSIKMECAFGNYFWVVGEFGQPFERDLRSFSDSVLGMEVEFGVHHELVEVR